MIPAPVFSLPFFILMFGVPFLAVILTFWLAVRIIFFLIKNKGSKTNFFSKKIIFLTILTLVCDVWLGYLIYLDASIGHKIEVADFYKKKRSYFILSHDYQYGELLIPEGSLINRSDPFDNGEPDLPLHLRGLQAVRFPHPVKVAGVWVTAIEPPRMELAKDQNIGPKIRFDRQPEYGRWVLDKENPTIACARGDIALFDIPLINDDVSNDIENELIKPDPDGPDAHFRPSEWRVIDCERNEDGIQLTPAYTEEMPK